jgi:hypothetical protein
VTLDLPDLLVQMPEEKLVLGDAPLAHDVRKP